MRLPRKGEILAAGAALVVGVGGTTALRDAYMYHPSKSDRSDVNKAMQPYVKQVAILAVRELHEHPDEVSFSKDGYFGEPTISIQTQRYYPKNGFLNNLVMSQIEVGMPTVDGSLDPLLANAMEVDYTPASDCVKPQPIQETVTVDDSPQDAAVYDHAYAAWSQICVDGQPVNFGIGLVANFEGSDVDSNPSDVAFLGSYALNLADKAFALPLVPFGS